MILLDTHVWLWARSSPEKLSSRARALIESEDLAVSAISCWEVATLARIGRLELDREVDTWIGGVLSQAPKIVAVPVSHEIATTAGGLGGSFPGDPADRIIFATAVRSRWSLLTKDRRLRAFSGDRTIWE